MAAPPPNWQGYFQQGFREVSQRFQSGAMQFGQIMQTGYLNAQNSFQGAASRASMAMRGYSQRFTNNNYNGGAPSFSQMSSANPQFGVPPPSFGGYSPDFPPRAGTGMAGLPSFAEKPDVAREGKPSRCTTKTLLGIIVIIMILAAGGGGIGVLFGLNDSRLAAANGVNDDEPGTGDNSTANDTSPLNRGGSSGAFAIDLVFISSVSQAQRDAFEQARARWEEIIVGDIPSEARVRQGDSFCGVSINREIRIDDILIFVDISPIDGAGRILGQAGPCAFDENDIPRLGRMTFDSVDVDQLIAVNQFSDVVLHEMGHVLGIGSLWDFPHRLLTAANPANPSGPVSYLGGGGNTGHSEIGGSGSRAVVENLGGQGTARGHWKDSVYQNELMTGFLSPGKNPLSRMTVRALADIGYKVDVSKADEFRVSSGRRLRGLAEKRLEITNDILEFPHVQLPTRPKGATEASFMIQPHIESVGKDDSS